MGILARLFLLLAIALVPTATIQIHDELARRHARGTELHAEAERLTRRAAIEQDRLLEGSRQLLATIAQLRPVLLQSRDLCAQTLGRVAAQQQRYAYLALSDLDGNLLCASTPKVSRDDVVAQLAFLRSAAAGSGMAVGNASATADGQRFLPLAMPVAGDGGKV